MPNPGTRVPGLVWKKRSGFGCPNRVGLLTAAGSYRELRTMKKPTKRVWNTRKDVTNEDVDWWTLSICLSAHGLLWKGNGFLISKINGLNFVTITLLLGLFSAASHWCARLELVIAKLIMLEMPSGEQIIFPLWFSHMDKAHMNKAIKLAGVKTRHLL
jgi:hypothetical protein